VDSSVKKALQTIFVPGGLLFFAALAVMDGNLLAITSGTAEFYFYGACLLAILLALRFRSSRILFALITLLLAERTVTFFSLGHPPVSGSGRIAFAAVALLVPLNFLIISVAEERGISWAAGVPRLAVLFFESVVVAIICRPGAELPPAVLRVTPVDPQWFHWTRIPQIALLAFAASFTISIVRLLVFRKAVDAGLLWACAGAFAACQVNSVSRNALVYWGTAALILAIALIENSYALAYHDELTGLPSRRSFNEDALGWQEPYTIAAVDIDHFKSFNDNHGHDTGDEVLRMVASRLARVTGGGKAFRVGGEEFSIVFPGKRVNDVLPHLENLRASVEQAVFRLRGGQERRHSEREGRDRRSDTIRNPSRATRRPDRDELSVTISIGVAEAGARLKSAEQVISAADKALYRAKRAGRNRVEIAPTRARTPCLKRSIA
jgi:diguanylate cyclase (GGDEF)-like protein